METDAREVVRVGEPRVLSRRQLLALGLGSAAVLAGCGQDRFRLRGDTETPVAVTVPGLVTNSPFYAAHRGGGDDWPEMTAYAYAQAARLPGLKALEISACLSSDGVLVCSHDASTKRVTGTDLVVAKETWSTLSELQVSSAGTHDPEQPSQPLARFEDIVRTYLDDFVLFVEPKVAAAVQPMMDLMVRLGQPTRVVWKQPINSTTFALARQHGFTTWGYVLDEPAHLGARLARFAESPDVDMLGVSDEQSDAFVREVVDAAEGNGKRTMAWPVRTPTRAQRAQDLGCSGLMTSDPYELLPAPR